MFYTLTLYSKHFCAAWYFYITQVEYLQYRKNKFAKSAYRLARRKYWNTWIFESVPIGKSTWLAKLSGNNDDILSFYFDKQIHLKNLVESFRSLGSGPSTLYLHRQHVWAHFLKWKSSSIYSLHTRLLHRSFETFGFSKYHWPMTQYRLQNLSTEKKSIDILISKYLDTTCFVAENKVTNLGAYYGFQWYACTQWLHTQIFMGCWK